MPPRRAPDILGNPLAGRRLQGQGFWSHLRSFVTTTRPKSSSKRNPQSVSKALTANIADVCGRIDYIQPGRSSLQDRGVYTPESLRAEYLRRHAPEAHQQELEAGYIKGLIEEAPAVITLNMRAAAACVNEFIARAYPFRLDPNRLYARTQFSLAACEEEFTAEDAFGVADNLMVGRGGREPLLGLPALALSRRGDR